MKAKMKVAAKAVEYAFKSWSYSRYADYTECPARACYKHLKRLPTSSSPQMSRGTDIHTKAEHFIDGKIKALPEELVKLKSHYATLRKRGLKGEIVQEQMWGHARDWTPVDPKAWDLCWMRTKMDVVYLTDKGRVLNVDDHKSGRIKVDAHTEQLSLYTVSALHRYSKLEEARGRMLYVDHGEVSKTFTLHRDNLANATDVWEHKVAFMFADRRFAPRPGNYCKWCDFSKAKGGPCDF